MAAGALKNMPTEQEVLRMKADGTYEIIMDSEAKPSDEITHFFDDEEGNFGFQMPDAKMTMRTEFADGFIPKLPFGFGPYPDATLTNFTEYQTDNTISKGLTMYSDAVIDDVIRYYHVHAQSQGFRGEPEEFETCEDDRSKGIVMHASHKDGHICSLTFSPMRYEDGQHIEISLTIVEYSI